MPVFGVLAGFNPHPSRRTGATRLGITCTLWLGFQSSPVPKDGCNPQHRYVMGVDLASFNPHPSRRTGATVRQVCPLPSQAVSILTRPEGRVQRYCQMVTSSMSACFNPHPSRRTGATTSNPPFGFSRCDIAFQSSPVPKDGCNLFVVGDALPLRTFQSSPVPKDGCNRR